MNHHSVYIYIQYTYHSLFCGIGCFQLEPSERPSFKQIRALLSGEDYQTVMSSKEVIKSRIYGFQEIIHISFFVYRARMEVYSLLQTKVISVLNLQKPIISQWNSKERRRSKDNHRVTPMKQKTPLNRKEIRNTIIKR
jgi:hypothetical protein